MKTLFTVYGWRSGHAYEDGEHPDFKKIISAKNVSDAEKKFEKWAADLHGGCDVIVAE